MSFADRLFPAHKRDFPAKRWVKISLRTLHLLGLAGFAGAYINTLELQLWWPFVALTLVSGMAMVVIELWTHGIWLLQLRGQAVILKLGLLVASLWTPMIGDLVLFALIIIISGLMSHAPGNVRYYSIFYRRRITPESWQWRS